MKLVVSEDPVTPSHLRNLVFGEAARAGCRVRLYSKHQLRLEVDLFDDRVDFTASSRCPAASKDSRVLEP